jgi:hypothetical protein
MNLKRVHSAISVPLRCTGRYYVETMCNEFSDRKSAAQLMVMATGHGESFPKSRDIVIAVVQSMSTLENVCYYFVP